MGWDALVAIATFLLAVGTGVLAGYTARLAQQTNELAKASRADLQAQWRPFIAPAVELSEWDPRREHVANRQPLNYSGYPDGTLYVRFRNVGRGPAIHLRTQVDSPAETKLVSAEVWAGSDEPLTLGAVAPGDEFEMRFNKVTSRNGVFQVLFDYRDLAGRKYATTMLIAGHHFYDVRTWEDHSVTAIAESRYPRHGLRDVSPGHNDQRAVRQNSP